MFPPSIKRLLSEKRSLGRQETKKKEFHESEKEDFSLNKKKRESGKRNLSLNKERRGNPQ